MLVVIVPVIMPESDMTALMPVSELSTQLPVTGATVAMVAGATFVTGSAQTCTLGLVGRKGRDFFGRRGFAVLFEQVGIFQKLKFEDARAIAQIASEPDPAADDDLVMRPLAPQPFAGGGHDVGKFHGRLYFVSSCSSSLIWSRNDAAVS